jgi:uncharacterized protein YndB with AHSA1/START domain
MTTATTAATARITPDNDSVVAEVFIAAPPQRVFQALTDSAQLRLWWTSEECPTEFLEFEARPGGRWRYATQQSTLDVNGVSKFACDGEVMEFDPPRLLAYTWIANWHDDKSRPTVVRWELTPASDGTRVKVTHSGLVREPVARKDYNGGWPGLLEQLKKFTECEFDKLLATLVEQ